MKSVFADADYWVALLNPQEELNERAKRVSAQLQPVRIVPSETVLVEVLNIMGSRGEAMILIFNRLDLWPCSEAQTES